MAFKLLYWILLTSIGSTWCGVISTGANNDCKIHQHLAGTCVPFTSCKFAMTILSLNDVQTLKSLFCGFEGSSPKVCCPAVKKYDKPTGTTIKPTQTTTLVYEHELEDINVITASPPHIPAPTANPLALPGRDVCGQITNGDRIYGGSIADIDEFPWQVRIKFVTPLTGQESYICSGTLINDRYVLTAAHCFGVWKVVNVRLGDWDTGTDIDCQDGYCNDGSLDVNVDKVIIHPGYNKRNLSYGDIAMLRLAKPVVFSDFIKPVCLPTTEYVARQDYVESTFKVIGWGLTEFGEPSELLRKVNLDLVPYSLCTSAIPTLPESNDPYVICAGGKQDRDSCQGDSGGPLLRIVSENYQQNWYLYGITSHGVKACGAAGKPGIYTRVTKYMDWILQTISEKYDH